MGDWFDQFMFKGGYYYSSIFCFSVYPTRRRGKVAYCYCVKEFGGGTRQAPAIGCCCCAVCYTPVFL